MENSKYKLPSYMLDFMHEEFRKFTKSSSQLSFVFNNSLEVDAYCIHDLEIQYATPSGALSGLYHYISAHYGINFASFKPSHTYSRPLESNKVYTPLLKRRGNVIEVINDITYLKELIAWMGYNGANEIFFTFFLWDEIKKDIYDDLKVRDIKITLGGHSLKYLLNKESLDVKSFTFANNQEIIITIANEVKKYNKITRISLWPEDVGIIDGNGDAFYEDYIVFTNALQAALPDINVEHIIYNAGLSWEMLEPPRIKDFTSKTNALYAYWGRDYSNAVFSSDRNQERANKALNWWINHQKQSGNEITIFEYYSDFFMMSEFYGPMTTVICDDLKWYIDQGVDSVVNLQVPIIKGRYFDQLEEKYDYKHLHNYNNFVYLRSLWGDSIDTIDDQWYSQFKEDAKVLKSLNRELESILPKFTKFNYHSFPLRYVDMIDSSMDEYLKSIVNLIDEAVNLKTTDLEWEKDYLILKNICHFYLQK